MFYMGLCLFFGPHGLMLIQPVRLRIQTFIPTAHYLGLFSLMSLFGLGLISAGYDPKFAIEAPVLPWVKLTSFVLFTKTSVILRGRAAGGAAPSAAFLNSPPFAFTVSMKV